ncbi:MAG: LysR family transcriptional regulator [Paracoccaceae bacterium]
MQRQKKPFRGTLGDGDLAALRDFLAIVEAGGLTAAEPLLNKSKAAISLSLTKLEQRLGMRLCERGRSGFALTEQGQLILTAARQLFSQINQFTDFVGATSLQISGEITVMIDDSFAFQMEEPIADAIAQMNIRYPRLQLKLRMTAPDRILSSVLDGTADLGLTALMQPNTALVVKPLFTEEMGLFCGRGHTLFQIEESEISYERLQDFSFIQTSISHDAEFTAFLSGFSFLASAPTVLSRMMLILSSRYLGFLPLHFADVWVAKGSVREIQMPGSRTSNACSVIHRKSRPLGMAAGIFKDILVTSLQK